jgi:methionyl-tRNA formyltransferase
VEKKKTIFMGTPEFALPSLEALLKGPYQVVSVYTQPDRPTGRGRSMALSPVKEYALQKGIAVEQPETLKSTEEKEKMAQYKPELIVVVAYGKLIPEDILILPEYGCINVHPSLLPKYRGASPIQTAILKGEQVTGVTIMLLDAGMDSGPVLRQEEVTIQNEDTAGTLSIKIADASAQLLERTLKEWMSGKIKPQPQDENKASYTETIEKGDGRIDWKLAAKDIWLRVKAYNPWPGCSTTWKGKKLRIESAIPLEEEVGGMVGKIIELPQEITTPVGVKCGKGVLGLVTIQLEGKRKMPVGEFIRGQRDFTGSILE